jgi:hypothetical protein
MSNKMQRAAFRRRISYGVLIFLLFGLSMFWRGKLSVPFAGQIPVSNWLTQRSVLAQAEKLEMREIDKGDPEIAGATARLACIGARGVIVTGLWYAAIEKQKRNEFYEFEIYARAVTRLQPNFITPWVFQSWNIAYNVSVENDKLGDMYFYIARGIELLAEGDRYNSKVYRGDNGEIRKVGSPDMRYQIGFYYQNKFGVSDKVATLRSLMQVSSIRLPDRKREALERNGQVDPVAFKKFCQANPQLVRRLRNKLNCQQPSEVVQFLADNEKIPTIYNVEGELLPDTEQFPILPEQFAEGPEEYYPGKPMDDTFDGFHAARAWFMYSLPVIPPSKVDVNGTPLPWRSPRAGEYDATRYRMPRAPAIFIFRQQAPRAQTYLADRLAAEGWFDKTSTYDPDEYAGTNNRWFPLTTTGEPVLLRTPTGSQQEWQRAFDMWDEHGERNAMKMSESRRFALMNTAEVRSNPSSQMPDGDKDIEESGMSRAKIEAYNALVYFEQNRSGANFNYFLETANAEKADITVQARKLLWDADQSRTSGRNNLATEQYRMALAKWRQVLETYKDFHRPYNSEKNEEDTYEFELKLIGLLKEDGVVRERARKVQDIAGAILGPIVVRSAEDYLQAVAEDEAVLQISTESMKSIWPTQSLPPDNPRAKALQQLNNLQTASGALGGSFGLPEVTGPIMQRGIINNSLSWIKEFKSEPAVRDDRGRAESQAYWVRPELRDTIKQRLGLIRKLPPAEPEPGTVPDGAMPSGPPGNPTARPVPPAVIAAPGGN